VREVGPNGIIRTVSGEVRFVAPSRVAHDSRKGWLYVADSSDNRIVALIVQSTSAGRRLVPRPFSSARERGVD
jgi:hypothetical protein